MRHLRTIAWLATSLALAVGCDQGVEETPCGEIPAKNGCPDNANRTGCAADHSCASTYSCAGGSWSLDEVCPDYDAGSSADANASAEAASPTDPDTGACIDLDLPPGASANGGTECTALEDSDCPVGEVACSPQSCVEFGCDSLFYCLNGNWVPWGGCAQDGGGVIKAM